MKKDLQSGKLCEKQLDNVQGGTSPDGSSKENYTVYCIYPGCNWTFRGTESAVTGAKAGHTMSYGHSEFLVRADV
ncbi:MAG: hypothetical protein BWY65_01715 [Firmicutes bacterium ADurb.Bin373]|nr:MAG: hypothetical protein BWY65_01715 [Firmicutes bacterium ADurb.Bin373]